MTELSWTGVAIDTAGFSFKDGWRKRRMGWYTGHYCKESTASFSRNQQIMKEEDLKVEALSECNRIYGGHTRV